MAPSPGPAVTAALTAALAGLLLALRVPAAVPPPDLLFFNATFWTADPAAPLAAALAVRAGRIQALGSRAALAVRSPSRAATQPAARAPCHPPSPPCPLQCILQALAGLQTRKVDLQGGFVAPGFVDAHLHFLGGGLELVKLDLRKVGGRDALAAVISAAAVGKESHPGHLSMRSVAHNAGAGYSTISSATPTLSTESRGAECTCWRPMWKLSCPLCNDVVTLRAGGPVLADVDSGAWIQGWGWNHDFWGALPSASWIDHVSPNNPVWLTRIDGHMGLANKVALERANIGMISPDPPGGTIVRDLAGSPSGLLQETAMQLVTRKLPVTSLADRRAALARACKHALSHGVTAIHDFGNFLPGSAPNAPWDDLNDLLAKEQPGKMLDSSAMFKAEVTMFLPLAEVYLHGDMTGDLLVRAYVFVPLESWPRLASRVAERGFWASDHLHWGGVKAFADGSVGSHTALFHEPYLDVEDTAGLEVATKEWLLEHALEADKATLQVAIHAIGDKAVDNVLDVYNEVSTVNGARDRRLRVRCSN
eukprot:SM000367S13682  [mRNA]  locus=s367:29505:32239:- [translate_table: standard]